MACDDANVRMAMACNHGAIGHRNPLTFHSFTGVLAGTALYQPDPATGGDVDTRCRAIGATSNLALIS